MGAPVGPAGCNGPKPAESPVTDGETAIEKRPTRGIQIAASYGRFWSHLHFEDDTEPDLTQQTVAGQLSYFFSPNWHLALSGGGVISGTLQGDGHDLDVGPGFLVSLRGTWRFLTERGAIPFASLSVGFTFSRSKFEADDGTNGHLWGTDVRGALTVGYTLFGVWQLYLSPRVFGGPVFVSDNTRDLQGRDRYFVQAGMGMGFLLPRGVTLFIDGSPAGEQAISAGAAIYLPTR